MKIKTTLIIILAIAGLLLFYWFEYRPTQIRKQCEHEVFSKAVLNTNMQKIKANNNFRQCLIKKGLEPESIFVNVE